MLIFDDDNNIYMEYQYRHPVKKVVFEIPAGKLEWGEDPSLAAIRELKEETGITSTELIKIGEMLNSVGYSDEIIHFYYAKIVSVGDTDLDDNEFINVVKMPFSEVKEKVLKNEIKDSKTAFGVMLYDNLVKEGLIK